MSEPATEVVEPGRDALDQGATGCPFHAPRTPLDPDDELVLPKHKRIVATYSTNELGAATLRIDYGDKEIVFDEPELFAFGEGLTRQSRFVARAATTWGNGYEWPRVQSLLEQLIEEGVLKDAGSVEAAPIGVNGARASPLPPASTTTARTWQECEAILGELTGRALELGYLELVVPVSRVAHIALDAEGRQVGEANVFPGRLRLDVPTMWRTCQHAGSRYQDDRPMNVTALKAMRKYWKPMMAALLQIREAYLRRFPEARQGWTVGDLERLSTLVLALPTYLLMRKENPVRNGELHPVLSSMFRVTDGVRLTMHDMLFTPINEPTRPAEAPMTSAELYAYAERTGGFFSNHGVCAGPRVMIEEFLRVLMDGERIEGAETEALEAPVRAALAEVEPAFDYALYGLQAYAVVFSLWPAMARAYERLWTIVAAWPEDQSEAFIALRERLARNVDLLRESLLRTEAWRESRDKVYAHIYERCAKGCRTAQPVTTLAERIAPVSATQHAHAADRLRAMLGLRFFKSASARSPALERLVDALMDYFRQEQGIVRGAIEVQGRINGLLGRNAPTRPFTASDIRLYVELQDSKQHLPYLPDELKAVLDLDALVTHDAIEISDRRIDARDRSVMNRAGAGPAESTCDGHGS